MLRILRHLAYEAPHHLTTYQHPDRCTPDPAPTTVAATSTGWVALTGPYDPQAITDLLARCTHSPARPADTDRARP